MSSFFYLISFISVLLFYFIASLQLLLPSVKTHSCNTKKTPVILLQPLVPSICHVFETFKKFLCLIYSQATIRRSVFVRSRKSGRWLRLSQPESDGSGPVCTQQVQGMGEVKQYHQSNWSQTQERLRFCFLLDSVYLNVIHLVATSLGTPVQLLLNEKKSCLSNIVVTR